MPGPELHIAAPEILGNLAACSPLIQALHGIARLADSRIAVEDGEAAATAQKMPIRYRERVLGQVAFRGEGCAALPHAARTIASLMEHALDREMAVNDLADAMNTSYEELNMLYTLMSEIVTRTHPPDIGQVVVDEAARILDCRRVSLLMLDDERSELHVLAAQGLPADAMRTTIPVSGSIAGQVLLDDDLLLVNDMADRPDLASMSRGRYQTQSFLVVRVPLLARGEPVGILTATERRNGREFTSRDRKLVEGLSSMAASALMNCRLHGTVNRQMLGTIKALASAVDAKDQYTHDHSARVSELCLRAAVHLGITQGQDRREIELAGLLHDIGKIGIRDDVLRKSTRLTATEYSAVKEHPKIGARIISQVQGLEAVAKAVLHHHERYDGLGYPGGLSREEIPLASRLIAAADTFDALTSSRPYRASLTTDDALRELQRNSGTQLAPEAVAAMTKVIG